jgi:hypothetical protein
MNDQITKPIMRDQLVEAMLRLLQRVPKDNGSDRTASGLAGQNTR